MKADRAQLVTFSLLVFAIAPFYRPVNDQKHQYKEKDFHLLTDRERENGLYHHRMVIVQSLPLFSLISGRSDNLSLAFSVCWSSELELCLSILQLLQAKSATSIKDKTNSSPKHGWEDTRCQLQASPGYIRNNPLRSLSRFHPDPLRWGLISTWHL